MPPGGRARPWPQSVIRQSAVNFVQRGRCWRLHRACPAASRAWRGFRGAALLASWLLIMSGTVQNARHHPPGARGWMQASRARAVNVSSPCGGCGAGACLEVHLTSRASRAITPLSHRPFHFRCAVRSCCCSCSWPPPVAAWLAPLGEWLGSNTSSGPRSLGPAVHRPAAARESLWTCVLTVPIAWTSPRPSSGDRGVRAGNLLPGAPAGRGTVLRTGVRHGKRGAAVLGKLADHSGIDFVYQSALSCR